MKKTPHIQQRRFCLQKFILFFCVITAADPSHSFRMTLNILPYYNVLPSAVIQHRELPADSSQLTAHSYQPSFPFRKIRVIYKNSGKSIQFLYFSMYNKVQTEGSADHLYWCSFYLPVRKTAELENFVFSTR